MVGDTLTTIENWFSEQSGDRDRPILLSKLALMEFCGWLEEWMDQLVRELDEACLCDAKWIEKNVIGNTNGFHYDQHFRPMLCRILGEHKIRNFEAELERTYPGDLEKIKADLGQLWKVRCSLAHSDVAAHRSAQIKIDAPSWTKNQFRILSKKLEAFRECLLSTL